MPLSVEAVYFRYWGKASPKSETAFHLLPFHSLDVAACGAALLRLPQYSLEGLARALGWPLPTVESLAVFFLLIHDVGKFSRGFQGLAPDLSADLVQNHKRLPYRYRHDTLGWLVWADDLSSDTLEPLLPDAESEFWGVWARTALGHHGKPPQEASHGGGDALYAEDHFLPEDRNAVDAFVSDVAATWLPADIPTPGRREVGVLRHHAWKLAGLAVLADWLGSNQSVFGYRTVPAPLQTYWTEVALPGAARVLDQAGLSRNPVRTWTTPLALFEHLREPTPLQNYAANVPLESSPQMFLLEDVTGAGKTEAALILAQRLMARGAAHGLFFALPSMATSNQMYERVGAVYRHFYEASARPSLILAHGARDLMEGFRQSVIQAGDQPQDPNYTTQDQTASAQCNAWLADNRKKALLADVGVGTIDQALLAVLPVRHQSLRLLGLAGKVLIVDEVHAYDSYMRVLLRRLLEAHARQGGTVILLSATLPSGYREQLVQAYRRGMGLMSDGISPDLRYPLATQVGASTSVHACETRPQLVRRVAVAPVHDETEAVSLVLAEAAAGRCVCWVRNTVEDARRTVDALSGSLPADRLTLFHSRYAIGDRLDIEADVLRRFGKHSGPDTRRGHVLIGTQVLEQSLDFDVDAMVTDLAPVDLIIQRAGRLQRHARLVDGTPSEDGTEYRSAPVLHVLCPTASDDPSPTWYAELFPKACHVYPNVGELWRSARALLTSGCIISPGQIGEAGAVRQLVEAVYGEDAEPIPETLERASREQLGKDLAQASQGGFNSLKLDLGYCWDSAPQHWPGAVEVPTRLGDETRVLYLAREVDGDVQPWRADLGKQAWDQSAVRVDARRVSELLPQDLGRLETVLDSLRSKHRLLEAPAVIVPMRREGDGWKADVADGSGRALTLHYDDVRGLWW